MNASASIPIPPGWYPDPAGSRQWRVWTGTDWSEVTRPYGERVDVPRPPHAFSLVVALRRVQNIGIVGIVGGLGLLVSVLAHWPGTEHPAPEWFAILATCAAAALLALGTTVCAFGVKELEGRWSLAAFVPGMNLFVASALVNRRLGMRPTWRIISEIVLLVVFAFSSRDELWLCAGPVIVAYLELTWFSALLDRLGARSSAELPCAA
jgi:Protein of unknown function (DUF2510)